MNASPTKPASKERGADTMSGWPILALNIATCLAVPFVFVTAFRQDQWELIISGFLVLVVMGVMWRGFFTLQPNEARVLVLFGDYRGTVRETGFHWANPFLKKIPVSVRARTLNVDKLKVNDKRGNPIEVAALIVWRVADTAQATFDVDNCCDYVRVQSETAVRHLAQSFSYDYGDDNEPTLRNGGEEIRALLRKELQDRLAKAGVVVDDARLTHLAYGAEIANVMFRRHQAEAVIASREKIVHGAVTMVDMALKELAIKDGVHLDEQRKAAMVSNLMVALCGETDAAPATNGGTSHN